MNDLTKLALCLRLREAQEAIGKLFEALAVEANPLAMLADAHTLSDLASELETALVGLTRKPSELPFVGANVEIGAEHAPGSERDRESQRVMAAQHERAADDLEQRRADDGIASLLVDEASATNSDRDHRGAA